MPFGDVANYLHIQVERSVKDVLETMNSRPDVPLQDCLTQYRYGMISFDVVPAPEFLDEAYNISTDDCRRLIEKLRLLYDYVIIDTTSMFSVLNLAMLDLSTIVTFLGVVDFIPTIKNMKIGNDTLRTLNYDTNKIRLVLNRSDAKTRISMEDVEQLLGGGFYHILPNDFKAASESIVTGVPLVLGGSDSVLATEIRKLISRYTNRAYEEDAGLSAFDDEGENGRRKSSGWFSKLFS